MKKLLSVIFAVLLVACSKVDDINVPRITELRFDIKVNNATDTKAVKTAWADGDQIYVFFKAGDSYLDAAKYVTLTYDSASTPAWTGSLSGSLTDAADLGSAGTMYGVNFPFANVSIASDGASGVTFLGNDGQPVYSYYLCGSTEYTVETEGDVATLTGTFDLTIPDDYVYFFIDKSGERYAESVKYHISVEGLKPAACTGFSAGTFTETELEARRHIPGFAYGTAGIAFSGKIDGSWAQANSHKFLLYSEDDPTVLSKTITAALPGHGTVKLKNPGDSANGWKKLGFRGYEVSPGLLMRDGVGNYSLTDGSNPFESYDYYGNSSSLNKYYFQWVSLRNELGPDGNNIKADSERLPAGWVFPAGGNGSGSDWYKILRNAPAETIQVEKADNTVDLIGAKDKSLAYVIITKGTKAYHGLLLLRDGAFIPKEGNLQTWGSGSVPNSITYEQYLVLKEAGCLFLAATGYYSTTFGWRDLNDTYREGHLWTATDRGSSLGYQASYDLVNGKLSYSPATSSNGDYMAARLVRKI